MVAELTFSSEWKLGLLSFDSLAYHEKGTNENGIAGFPLQCTKWYKDLGAPLISFVECICPHRSPQLPKLNSLSSLNMAEILDIMVFVSNLLAGNPDNPNDDGLLVCLSTPIHRNARIEYTVIIS